MRAAAVTLHAGCKKLKDFRLYHVSPSMTTTGQFMPSQEHMETTEGAYVVHLYPQASGGGSTAFKIKNTELLSAKCT